MCAGTAPQIASSWFSVQLRSLKVCWKCFFFQDQDIKSLDSSHEIRFEDGLSHLVVGTSGRFVKKKTKYSFLFNISCHMKEIEYAAIYSGRTQSHMDVQ